MISLENAVLILDIFRDMKNMFDYLGDIYRSTAYEHAMNSIQNTRELEGMGKALQKKAKEIMETGDLEAQKQLKEVIGLINVPGFGKKKILKILKELKGQILDEYLVEANLTSLQELGLKYYKRLKRDIHRDDVRDISKKLEGFLKRRSAFSSYMVCGGYRRGKEYTKDIDIVIVPDEDLKSGGDITEMIHGYSSSGRRRDIEYEASVVSGKRKFTFYLKVTDKYSPFTGKKLKRPTSWFAQVDFIYISEEEYPSAVLYFTGNRAFNIISRRRAIDMGYKLNEYGLWKGKKRMDVESEEEILDMLEFDTKYYNPRNREK